MGNGPRVLDKVTKIWIREERDYGETVVLMAPESIIVQSTDMILEDVSLWAAYATAALAAGDAWRAVVAACRPSTAAERNARRREMSPGEDESWLPIEPEED